MSVPSRHRPPPAAVSGHGRLGISVGVAYGSYRLARWACPGGVTDDAGLEARQDVPKRCDPLGVDHPDPAPSGRRAESPLPTIRDVAPTPVRTAVAADAPSIRSILNALLSSTTIEWRREPHSLDDVVAWMDAHERILVAEDKGEIVGLAAFGPFRDIVKWPGYRFTVENTIHVRQDRWGLGIGMALMTALIAEARAAGAHAMVAAVDGSNQRSIQLHQRLGFVRVAQMPEVGAKFGEWLDLVLLELLLDDRSGPGGD